MAPLNPQGRPKGSMNKYTILSRELLTERGPEIVQVIIDRALKGGIPMVALFPKPKNKLKDDHGSESLYEKNLVCRAILEIKKHVQ